MPGMYSILMSVLLLLKLTEDYDQSTATIPMEEIKNHRQVSMEHNTS